jgi:hypothetical protein
VPPNAALAIEVIHRLEGREGDQGVGVSMPERAPFAAFRDHRADALGRLLHAVFRGS